MKLTLRELIDKYTAFKNITNKKFPAKLSYAISKNMIMLEEEAKIIDDNRIKLAQTYAKKNEDGTAQVVENSYIIEDLESFNKELDEYYKTETDVDVCTVSRHELDKLDDPRYDVLSPSEMMSLQFMLEDCEHNVVEN